MKFLAREQSKSLFLIFRKIKPEVYLFLLNDLVVVALFAWPHAIATILVRTLEERVVSVARELVASFALWCLITIAIFVVKWLNMLSGLGAWVPSSSSTRSCFCSWGFLNVELDSLFGWFVGMLIILLELHMILVCWRIVLDGVATRCTV